MRSTVDLLLLASLNEKLMMNGEKVIKRSMHLLLLLQFAYDS